MASYMVGVVGKHDLQKYGLYAAAGYQSIEGFDVEVSVAEQPETLEGTFPGTTIIMMKFKDDDGAKRWYQSDLYQSAIPLRHASAGTAFIVLFTDTGGQS
jgi:uncharacterized protein (DUF1330 family)